jgi:hypothetical protein
MALNSDEQVDQWVEDFMQRYREYVTD